MTFRQEDTIAAISTPLGEGGIGIVRLSGAEALAIADRIFRNRKRQKPSRMKSHSLCYGHIMASQKPVDEVLLTIMRAPRTYTREDIVEINCHGGIIPLRKILELVLNKGARLAQPGEFTRRAFLNGRIDLARAEAVIEIIRAKTQLSLQVAMSHLGGYFSEKVERLNKKLLNLVAEVEVSIDFPEENLLLSHKKERQKKISKIETEIKAFLDSARDGKVLREGIRTVITGRPNVGKSSLWNALLGEERALVTPLPGTTRDALEETINLQGFPLRLVDTAGIRAARGRVEKASVARSQRSLKEADLVLIVLDGSRVLTKTDRALIASLKEKPTLIIINKIDLPQKIKIKETLKALGGKRGIQVSAKQGTGLPGLKQAIAKLFWKGKVPAPETLLVTNARHQAALARALGGMKRARGALERDLPLEFVARDLRLAWESLGAISGAGAGDEILEQIFSRFCIGK